MSARSQWGITPEQNLPPDGLPKEGTVPCLLLLADYRREFCGTCRTANARQPLSGNQRQSGRGKPRPQAKDSRTPDSPAGACTRRTAKATFPFPAIGVPSARHGTGATADKCLFLPACAANLQPPRNRRERRGCQRKSRTPLPDEPPDRQDWHGLQAPFRHRLGMRVSACAFRHGPRSQRAGLAPGSPTAPGPTPGFPSEEFAKT